MSDEEFVVTEQSQYFPVPNHVPIGSFRFLSVPFRFQGSIGILGAAVFDASKRADVEERRGCES
jgi:hypothetical protein